MALARLVNERPTSSHTRMIRFRIGQTWKREPAATPVDSVALEIDGVNLLAEASEENIAQVVFELVSQMLGLFDEGERFGQLSLPEAHLEVCWVRKEAEVELSVVRLSRPARLTRAPVRLDLSELRDAVARSARALLADLSQLAPRLLRQEPLKKLRLRVGELERRPFGSARTEARLTAPRTVESAEGSITAKVAMLDPDRRLEAYTRSSQAGLPSLLCEGEISLAVGDAPIWRAKGPVFLLALELTRHAQDVLHALELEEKELILRLCDQGAPLRLNLSAPILTMGSASYPVSAQELGRALYRLGMDLAMHLASVNKAQAKNPYVLELLGKSKEGLSALKEASPAPGEAGAPSRPRRRTGGAPIRTHGRLRRLHFRKLWERHRLFDAGAGRLLVGKQGVIVSSLELASCFAKTGELLFRREATHGVAVSERSTVLTASADRVVRFEGSGDARWLRDHDGLSLGPELLHQDGLLFALSEGRNVLVFTEAVGRELWRICPPRTQRTYLLVHGKRALLTTDSGYLYGVEISDGQVRYRVRSALPFLGPAIAWGKKAIACLSRGERLVMFAADTHSGEVAWSTELSISSPSLPLAGPSRVWVAGVLSGATTLVALGGHGKKVWERKLHLGKRTILTPVGRNVVVTAADGACTMVGAEGQILWHLGSAGEELSAPLPALPSKGLLIIPGEVVRAVDPKSGRVLAEVKAGAGLCDVKTDSELNLFLLDEEGALAAFQLASHLAVI